MYNHLENQKIDILKKEFKDFPAFLNGHIFIKYDNGFITSDGIKPVVEEEVPVDENVVPTKITRLQAKLQLSEIGKFSQAEVFVQKDEKAKIYWSDADYFYRNDEILLYMAEILEINDEQLDDLFLKASKL